MLRTAAGVIDDCQISDFVLLQDLQKKNKKPIL